MTIAFEIGTAMLVGISVVTTVVLRRRPWQAAFSVILSALVLMAWANIAAGLNLNHVAETAAEQVRQTTFSDRARVARAISTFALLAVAWCVAGMIFRDGPAPDADFLRGRKLQFRPPSKFKTSRRGLPARRYRSS
jgi:hypothetical protein